MITRYQIWRSLYFVFLAQVALMIWVIYQDNVWMQLTIQGTTILTAIAGWYTRPDRKTSEQSREDNEINKHKR